MPPDKEHTDPQLCMDLTDIPQETRDQLLLAVVNGVKNAILALNMEEGKVVCINEACHLLSKEAILQLLKQTRDNIQKTITDDDAISYFITKMLREGQGEREFQVFFAPLKIDWKEQNNHCYRVEVEDVTEKNRTLESDKRQKELIERIGVGICIVDADENFIESNPAADRMFGIKEGETLVGKNLKQFMTPEQFDHVRQETEKRARGEQSTYDFEITIGATAHIISVTATPRFDPDGNFLGSYGVLQDMTERRRMEKEITYLSGKLSLSRVDTFMNLLAMKDKETWSHSNGVKTLANKVAHYYMMEKPEKPLNLVKLNLASRYHDIGKIVVDKEILQKPGKLSQEERLEMEMHSDFGFILALVNPELAEVAEWIYTIHQYPDGSGYPRNHTDQKLPIEVLIIAAADALETMVSGRRHQKPKTKAEIIEEFTKYSGTQFDPEVARVVIDHIDDLLQVLSDRKQLPKEEFMPSGFTKT